MGWGDELIATGQAVALQRDDKRRVAIRGRDGRARWHPIFEGNRRLVRPEEAAHDPKAFQWLDNYSGHRPYIANKSRERWFWRPFNPTPGEVYLEQREDAYGRAHAGLLVIEPHVKPHMIGKANGNKDWGWERWQAVVDALPSLPWAQCGPPGIRLLRGVRKVETPNFRQLIAVLKHGLGYVGVEGGPHHAAAAVGKPAVVIFGGFIWPDQTGYRSHCNLFAGDEPCGMRVPCPHCRTAMAAISVESVITAVGGILGRSLRAAP